MPRLRPLFALALLTALGLAVLRAAAAPLTFEFIPPAAPDIANPHARELWGEVTTPSGRILLLPAYYAGQRRYAVRARPDETGTFQLTRVLEGTRGQAATEITAEFPTPRTVENSRLSRLPALGLHPHDPARFARSDGREFIPHGANLAWARADEPVAYYRNALPRFATASLNWMRVWMAHWGRTNLDWLHPDEGPSPPPGGLDPRVADRWDHILAAAEENGVYLQLVLQHHGQFSTTVNPNWSDHPWNAANPGGFLRSPADFFTDPRARLLTALKYRYIVARWSWSPAVFAWELFNEVHWVDALKLDHDEAAVARWHHEMATYLRAIDPYRHLVTTSTEDLRSPIFDAMDFLQPHLYPVDLFPAIRSLAPRHPTDRRPAFYGEFGDDHLALPPAVQATGLADTAPVWASLMSAHRLPAQPWEGWRLLENDKLAELGAVHRFHLHSGLARHRDAAPFSPPVESASRSPLLLRAVQHWQRRPAADLTLPLDATEPPALADWPSAFVKPESHRLDGFPMRSTFRADFPADTTLRLTVDAIGARGGDLRVLIDGQTALDQSWPAGAPLPTVLTLPVPAGPRTITLENTGDADWVRVPHIDLGLAASDLTAVGRRNDRFVALWIRHRTNLLSPTPGPAAAGHIRLDVLPAGRWTVQWWDTTTGTPTTSTTLDHPGGALSLPTPAIHRQAAVTLTLTPPASN